MRRRSPRTDNPRRHTRTGKTAATAGTNGRRKMATDAEALPAGGEKKQNEALVITASSLGTVFEWYDFYLYGLLATALSHHFFAGVNETTGFILALMAFAAGFAVRPFGALVFGRVGDIVGRKNTFLVTMAIMGLAHLRVDRKSTRLKSSH